MERVEPGEQRRRSDGSRSSGGRASAPCRARSPGSPRWCARPPAHRRRCSPARAAARSAPAPRRCCRKSGAAVSAAIAAISARCAASARSKAGGKCSGLIASSGGTPNGAVQSASSGFAAFWHHRAESPGFAQCNGPLAATNRRNRRLDPAPPFRIHCAAMLDATNKPRGSRRINWINVSTVLSAAILIAAEVFGAAFAGGWAFGNLFALGEYGTYILQVLFFVLGIAVMVAFIRAAHARRAVHRRATESLSAPRRRSLNKLLTFLRSSAKKLACIPRTSSYFANCPISHVPVAACRLVGIRTRGRTAAWGRDLASSTMQPAAGGETGAPRAQRGTRLKATTERAFLVTPARMPD